MSRIALVAITLTGLVVAAGCARSVTRQDEQPAGERIVEVATGREVSATELLDQLRASDYVLLGEQHDNVLHHQRRGELLMALGPGVPVVVEHLPRGKTVQPGERLLPRLQAAGFDAKAWAWPLHEALFAPAVSSGRPAAGANAPVDLARRVAREGEGAMPPDHLRLLRSSPLDAQASATLDVDLVDGHCGMLAGDRLAGMRWAQRLRDASMWMALREVADLHGKPAVLLAGNGHVRDDYGVPVLARLQQPTARVISVGFVDSGRLHVALPYTYIWHTAAPASRKDACESLK